MPNLRKSPWKWRTRKYSYLRWITYSQRPTPPAWGHTGTPNLSGAVNHERRCRDYNVLGCHEQDTENFAHSSKSARVDLHYVDRVSLQKLLENHPIMRVFPSCYSDSMWFKRLANGSMTQNVIWSSWLLDKPTPMSVNIFSNHSDYTPTRVWYPRAP